VEHLEYLELRVQLELTVLLVFLEHLVHQEHLVLNGTIFGSSGTSGAQWNKRKLKVLQGTSWYIWFMEQHPGTSHLEHAGISGTSGQTGTSGTSGTTPPGLYVWNCWYIWCKLVQAGTSGTTRSGLFWNCWYGWYIRIRLEHLEHLATPPNLTSGTSGTHGFALTGTTNNGLLTYQDVPIGVQVESVESNLTFDGTSLSSNRKHSSIYTYNFNYV
jgi:hypothetical protein